MVELSQQNKLKELHEMIGAMIEVNDDVDIN